MSNGIKRGQLEDVWNRWEVTLENIYVQVSEHGNGLVMTLGEIGVQDSGYFDCIGCGIIKG